MINGTSSWNRSSWDSPISMRETNDIDPRASAEQLRQILAENPAKALAVAIHPHADQSLRSWLWRNGDDQLRTEMYRHYLFQREQLLSAWLPLPPEAVEYDAKLMLMQQELQSADRRAASEDIYNTVLTARSSVSVPRAEQYQLCISDGSIVPLMEPTVLLGREPSTGGIGNAQTVSLKDPTREISRTHAKLEMQHGEWTITDLGSTNGVYIGVGETRIKAVSGVPYVVSKQFSIGSQEMVIQVRDGRA